MNRTIHPLLYLGMALGTGALAVLTWYLLKRLFGLGTYELPAPHEILLAGWSEREALLAATANTARNALVGFALGVGIGFALASVMSVSRLATASLYPWILVLQMMPIVVLVPILVVWFHPHADRAVISITLIISIFPVIANTYRGLVSVGRNYRELFALYGANRWEEFWRLRVPFALPYFFTGLTIAATLATVGALTGEIFAGTGSRGGGLGLRVLVYYREARTPEVFATGLMACALGFMFVGSVSLLNKYALLRWDRAEG